MGHPQIKIYTLYTFYTATKTGFATTSVIYSLAELDEFGLPSQSSASLSEG